MALKHNPVWWIWDCNLYNLLLNIKDIKVQCLCLTIGLWQRLLRELPRRSGGMGIQCRR